MAPAADRHVTSARTTLLLAPLVVAALLVAVPAPTTAMVDELPEQAAQPPATSAVGCSPTLDAPPDPPGQVHVFLNEGVPTRTDAALPTLGTLKTVMLYVDFSDFPQTQSTQSLHDKLAPSAVDYFDAASYGRFQLQIDQAPTWYRMPRPYADYFENDQGGLPHDEQQDFIRDAMTLADDAVDFSQYKGVYVVASQGSLPGVFVLPKLKPGFGITMDGTEMQAWMGIGSVAYYEAEPGMGAKNSTWHDTAHWLGLPDLYGRTPTSTTHEYVGSWDLMSDNVIGPHFLAWHNYKLGWIDPAQLHCLSSPGETQVDLTPASVTGGVKALVVPTGPSTAYVVEARRKTGIDAGLCDDGVLIYHVDATVWNGNGPVHVRRAQPDDAALAGYYDCGPAYNAAYDVGAGEVSVFEEGDLRVEVLASTESGYTVRATLAGEPEHQTHARTVALTLKKHLRVRGSVTSPTGPSRCTDKVTVRVLRKKGIGWKTVGRPVTDTTGAFVTRVPDRPGRYRVAVDLDTDPLDYCAAATSRVVRHRH